MLIREQNKTTRSELVENDVSEKSRLNVPRFGPAHQSPPACDVTSFGVTWGERCAREVTTRRPSLWPRPHVTSHPVTFLHEIYNHYTLYYNTVKITWNNSGS